MSQFIQETPQVRNPGIGNQRVVQDRSPLLGNTISQVGKGAADAFSTATNIYAEGKAQEMVDQSLGDLEEAVALAEKREKLRETPGTVIDPRETEELGVSDDEFQMIEAAVRNGAMTREKARLMASSRLKSRIAEQPFAEKQLRRAASNIVGFNIESESARQYFAAFPSEGQTGQSQNDYRQGKLEQAQSVAEALGVDVDEAYRVLVRSDFAKEQKAAADAQLELGSMSAQQWATEHLNADGSTAFGGVLAEIKRAEQEGSPVDSVVINNAIKLRKESALQDLRTGWEKSGGTVGSEDFVRTRKELENRYEGYQELITSVGFDNLNQIKIERAERTREMIGDKLFPKMKTLSQNFGQQVASDVFNLLSHVSNESQLKPMLDRNPALKEAYNFMNRDNRQFAQTFSDVAEKLLNGQELTEQEAAMADVVASRLYKNGSKETQTSTIQGLAQMGGKFKGLSLMASTSPRNASQENINTFRRMYREDMPMLVNSIGRRIAQRSDVDWSIDENGDFQLDLPEQNNLESFSAGFASRSTYDAELASLNEDVEKLNQFSKAQRNGWSQVVDENVEQYRTKLNRTVQESVDSANTAQLDQLSTDFVNAVTNADTESARNTWEKLRERNPGGYSADFQAVYNEARRRAGLPSPGGNRPLREQNFEASMEAREGGQ